MPFKSKAQMRMMFAQDPEMAKRWAKETPSPKSLPEHAKPKRKPKAKKKSPKKRHHPKKPQWPSGG
jgi:hypothetical protein